MRPFALACVALALLASPPPLSSAPGWSGIPADTAYQVEEVRFRAPDGIDLAGLLFVPVGEGPFPGAVVIHGSGESDRTNVWARAFAETLARAGVATLLPDKRGSGESGGEWRTATFETLARDALAGVERMAAHPKVDADEIGVVGLSQGGHVAPLAADLSAEVAWVVNVSGATVSMLEQIRHEMRNTARQAGLPPEGVDAILEIQRRAERYVETGEWAPYAAALEAAEGTPWAPVADGFPQTPDSPVWTWARLNGAYDPIPYWKRLDVPILVLYGEEDESDNVPVAESVRRLEAALEEAGHEDYRIRVIPGAGHGIWAPDTDHAGHDHRLHPDLVDLLTGWILARAGGGAAAGSSWGTDLSAAVDSLVAARMDADRIPGAAVAFVVDGALVHTGEYGVADVSTGRAVAFDQTVWRIGSTTKALTGLALAALAEREGIDLSAEVSAWLDPGLLPVGPGEEPIRIRHLLTHSAGFDQTGLGRRVEEPALRPTLKTFLREELVRVRPPGEVGVYDTYGITLAGHLIERIGGLTYPDHMRKAVFEPLGMRRTWVETPEFEREALAVGYGLEDGEWIPQEYEWYVTLPASSVDATAADMARLLTVLLGDGGGPISADLARRIRFEPQLVYGSGMGAFSWVFWEDRRAGRRAIHHGGIMAGYSSELY
ncbi:MAG: serine hydrolase, partial [Gemmatimonadetes bacterium]|nr:serine hydrolase [Gemmatimonadota bacterium]